MKLLFKDLPGLRIQKLIICSIDQALYQAIVVVEGKECLVWETDKACVRGRSLMALREQFEGLDIPETLLRHESAYDEMIGLAGNASGNRLEVRLGKELYPQLQ